MAYSADDNVVEVGRIELHDYPPVIEAPTSVAVEEEFLVRVMSYGGGCISFERTDVELTNEGADVVPLDRRHMPGKNEGCTADLRLIPHEAALTFSTVGSKTIRVHGRRVSSQVDETIEIPLTVVVQ